MSSGYCAIPFFETQVGDQVLLTLIGSKFKAFPILCYHCSQFVFENVGNRTKPNIVTPILLNARDLSTNIMFYFMS